MIDVMGIDANISTPFADEIGIRRRMIAHPSPNIYIVMFGNLSLILLKSVCRPYDNCKAQEDLYWQKAYKIPPNQLCQLKTENYFDEKN